MATSNPFHKHQKVDSGVATSVKNLTISDDYGETAHYQPTTGKGLRLLALPNELLLKIAGYLRVDLPWMEKEERFGGQERIEFVTDAADLISLSRTCRMLHPVAQEALLHTAVLGGFDGASSIESLVQLLLHRPALRKALRRLRIGLPPQWRLFSKSEEANGFWKNKLPGLPPTQLLIEGDGVIDQTPFDIALKTDWRRALKNSYAQPLCGILLALTPKLQYLSVAHSVGGENPNRVLRQMFGIHGNEIEADFSALPALTNLCYLNDATPADQRPLSSLTIGWNLHGRGY